MNNFSKRLPRNLYRADQVQQLDHLAINQFGIPGFKLMQLAGAVCFDALLESWPLTRHLTIFCGGGNNGGDGYIIAGLAREQGMTVELVQLAATQSLKGDAERALQWARERKIEPVPFADFAARTDAFHLNSVLVDALLGTGLDRKVSGDYESAIKLINDTELPVLAVDIPSGLSANTGMPQGLTVCADLTISFIGMKQGLLTGLAGDFTGELCYHRLDVSEEVFNCDSAPAPSAQRIDINYALNYLKPRARSSHKGSHGHVVLIGGDLQYGGAILMAAQAALRSGAGLVSVLTRSVHRCAILARCPEIMVMGSEDDGSDSEQLAGLLDRATALVIGPGLGRGKWSQQLFQSALAAQSARNIPAVIDAGGLYLLAERSPAKKLSIKRDKWILTPHPGEAAVLLDKSIEEIQADRFAAVAELTKTWGAVSLLKGSGSLICSNEGQQQKIFLCSEGNAGMASGGMGDVLSGIVGSMLAQGLSLEESLCTAVCIHGEAADLSAQDHGQKGMLATDLFDYIRQLVNPSL